MNIKDTYLYDVDKYPSTVLIEIRMLIIDAFSYSFQSEKKISLRLVEIEFFLMGTIRRRKEEFIYNITSIAWTLIAIPENDWGSVEETAETRFSSVSSSS